MIARSTRRRPLLLAAGLLLAPALAAAPPAAAKLTPEMRARAVSTLETGARSGDFTNRAMAVAGLGMAPKATALPLVKDALTDPQWQVRRAAIAASLDLKDRSWEQAVLDAMKKDAVDAGSEVLPILEPLGTRAAVAVLLKGLEQKDLSRPGRYAEALARAGGELMDEAYLAALRSRRGDVKAAFTEALGALPLPDAAPLYEKVLASAPTTAQRQVLERLVADPGLTNADFVLPLLKSKDREIAVHAAAALAQRGNPAGKALLLQAAAGEDAELKLHAIEAMRGIASSDLFDVLRPIVNDEESDTRLLRAAYRVFAEAGHPKLASHLEKRLLSVDLDRRAAAVAVLGRIKGKAALPQLHPLLGDGAQPIRIGAAQAIGDIADPASVPALRDALYREPDDDVRLALIDALGRIRTPEIVPALQQYVYDPSDALRAATVRALAAVRHQSAAPLLDLLLRDRDAAIRTAALVALLELGPARHLEAFKQALGWIEPDRLGGLVAAHGEAMIPHLRLALDADRDALREAALAALAALPEASRASLYEELARSSKRPAMRVAGVEGLVATRGARALPEFTALAKDPEKLVRVAAIEALGQLRAKDAEALLFELTDDADERVRIAAAAALLRL